MKHLLLFIGFLIYIGYGVLFTLYKGLFGDNYLLLYISLAGFVAYILMWIFLTKKMKRKNRIILISIISAPLIAPLWYAGYDSYEKSLPVLNEGINPTHDEYKPFSGKNILAKLDKPSELKLTENLPSLDGSTALYPMYAAFAEAVYPQQEFTTPEAQQRFLRAGKTGQAYEDLIEGKVDIIFVPAPSKAHQQKAEEKGIKFNLTPIGKEAFVFFVNIDNKIRGCSRLAAMLYYKNEDNPL